MKPMKAINNASNSRLRAGPKMTLKFLPRLLITFFQAVKGRLVCRTYEDRTTVGEAAGGGMTKEKKRRLSLGLGWGSWGV